MVYVYAAWLKEVRSISVRLQCQQAPLFCGQNFSIRSPDLGAVPVIFHSVEFDKFLEANRFLERFLNLKKISWVLWNELTNHVVFPWRPPALGSFMCCDSAPSFLQENLSYPPPRGHLRWNTPRDSMRYAGCHLTTLLQVLHCESCHVSCRWNTPKMPSYWRWKCGILGCHLMPDDAIWQLCTNPSRVLHCESARSLSRG